MHYLKSLKILAELWCHPGTLFLAALLRSKQIQKAGSQVIAIKGSNPFWTLDLLRMLGADTTLPASATQYVFSSTYLTTGPACSSTTSATSPSTKTSSAESPRNAEPETCSRSRRSSRPSLPSVPAATWWQCTATRTSLQRPPRPAGSELKGSETWRRVVQTFSVLLKSWNFSTWSHIYWKCAQYPPWRFF